MKGKFFLIWAVLFLNIALLADSKSFTPEEYSGDSNCMEATGNLRCSSTLTISCPTISLTPTIATLYLFMAFPTALAGYPTHKLAPCVLSLP